MNDLELAEVYDAAADYIEIHGWTRKVLRDNTGAVCVSGALCAVTDTEMFKQATTQTIAVLGDAYNRWVSSCTRLQMALGLSMAISSWNDNVVGDQYEVTDALRSAAKGLREER